VFLVFLRSIEFDPEGEFSRANRDPKENHPRGNRIFTQSSPKADVTRHPARFLCHAGPNLDNRRQSWNKGSSPGPRRPPDGFDITQFPSVVNGEQVDFACRPDV
jgi:hypothetical protein